LHAQRDCFAPLAGIPNDALNFDLVNEPLDIADSPHGRCQSGERSGSENTIDGLGGGNLAMPELNDLDVIQSGRGYQPMAVSHYQATWWKDHHSLPEPIYPGTRWNGKEWNGAKYESYHGYNVDRALLDLLLTHRL
jgi:hypothetical protein